MKLPAIDYCAMGAAACHEQRLAFCLHEDKARGSTCVNAQRLLCPLTRLLVGFGRRERKKLAEALRLCIQLQHGRPRLRNHVLASSTDAECSFLIGAIHVKRLSNGKIVFAAVLKPCQAGRTPQKWDRKGDTIRRCLSAGRAKYLLSSVACSRCDHRLKLCTKSLKEYPLSCWFQAMGVGSTCQNQCGISVQVLTMLRRWT
jgi:hypothetical protein